MTDDVSFEEGESVVVDFNNVEDDAGFEALPAGMYEGTISTCEFKYSNSSGNPMWSIQWEVTDGDYAGRILFTHMVMAGKGLPITKKHLTRIRPELLEGPFNPEDEDVIEGMLGICAKLKVIQKRWDGQMTNNVKDVFASEGVSEF